MSLSERKWRQIEQARSAFKNYYDAMEIERVASKRRTRSTAALRHRGMQHLRSLGYSYPVIGAVFGKDHSTVIHACRKKVALQLPPEDFGCRATSNVHSPITENVLNAKPSYPVVAQREGDLINLKEKRI